MHVVCSSDHLTSERAPPVADIIRIERFITERIDRCRAKIADHDGSVLAVFMHQKSTETEKPKPSERSAIKVDPDGGAS